MREQGQRGGGGWKNVLRHKGRGRKGQREQEEDTYWEPKRRMVHRKKKWKEVRSVCRRGVFSSCIMHHDRIWGIKAFLTKSWRQREKNDFTCFLACLISSSLSFFLLFSLLSCRRKTDAVRANASRNYFCLRRGEREKRRDEN